MSEDFLKDPLSLFGVKGKTAIITGATGAFGVIAAKTLAAAGASVVLCANGAEALKKVAAECEKLGGKTEVVAKRPSSEANCDSIVDAAVKKFGGVDILVVASGQNKVAKIYYPGLPEHPGYEAHRRQATGPGAVLSFELENIEVTRKLLEGVKLAAFAVSLGGVESILSYPAKMSHAAMPPAEREARGIKDTLVRLSVGLEDADDLIADMDKILNG